MSVAFCRNGWCLMLAFDPQDPDDQESWTVDTEGKIKGSERDAAVWDDPASGIAEAVMICEATSGKQRPRRLRQPHGSALSANTN